MGVFMGGISLMLWMRLYFQVLSGEIVMRAGLRALACGIVYSYRGAGN